MTDNQSTIDLEKITQAQFCAYCDRLSLVFDHVLQQHGPHTGLNTAAALLGYALFRVSKPEGVDGLAEEVVEQASTFARDLYAAKHATRQ